MLQPNALNKLNKEMIFDNQKVRKIVFVAQHPN